MNKTILDVHPDKIEVIGDCWLWTGAKAGIGYGVIGKWDNESKKTKLSYAHRVSYQMSNGEIPKGNVVMHSCDTPNCVNPDHLSTGTQQDNIHDAILKKRNHDLPPRRGSEHGMSIVNEDAVREIRKDGRKYADIAKDYGLSVRQVSKIVRREAWKHVE